MCGGSGGGGGGGGGCGGFDEFRKGRQECIDHACRSDGCVRSDVIIVGSMSSL